MSLRQFVSTNHNAELDQSSLENDKPPGYTSESNVTTALTHTQISLAGLPNETRSSLTDALGLAETSKEATPNYSKRPSDKFKFSQKFSFA